MKIYIVGINFNKYSLLSKMEQLLKNDYNADVEYIDWLGKKKFNKDSISDGNGYIYVEIENLFDTKPFMCIVADEVKKSIATKFASFIEEIPAVEEKIESVQDEIVVEEPIAQDSEVEYNEAINSDIDSTLTVPIITQEVKKSCLAGINVEIDGKEYYIPKD